MFAKDLNPERCSTAEMRQRPHSPAGCSPHFRGRHDTQLPSGVKGRR